MATSRQRYKQQHFLCSFVNHTNLLYIYYLCVAQFNSKGSLPALDNEMSIQPFICSHISLHIFHISFTPVLPYTLSFLFFPQPERSDILKWLRINLADRNLQATPWYLEKILQIYEMLLVRHGLMVVGGPMGGKTTAYQVSEQQPIKWCGRHN